MTVAASSIPPPPSGPPQKGTGSEPNLPAAVENACSRGACPLLRRAARGTAGWGCRVRASFGPGGSWEDEAPAEPGPAVRSARLTGARGVARM